jgi:pantoate--beta-alanine ligase
LTATSPRAATPPLTVLTPGELTALRDEWEAAGRRVAFVPTMGALHEGHLSLVKQARTLADHVIVSIFVNPMQFGPNEDFARYPRTLKEDMELLTAVGTEALYLPSAASVYPDGFQTAVVNDRMARGLCGASRPGHFNGVLTVVLKLFNTARPHVAVFGKKDYQQWRLIARMVEDLNLRVDVVGCETLRDADGLAKSSRNRYLSDAERQTALKLSLGLNAAKSAWAKGERQAAALREAFLKVVAGVGGLELEYVELRRQGDLGEVAPTVAGPAVLLTAARVGATRLIDNMELS